MLGDCGSHGHKRKADRRDGKENMHSCLLKDNKCVDFVQLIRFMVAISTKYSEKAE